jgi:RimJ/RimL family protein N-acetyltransferase
MNAIPDYELPVRAGTAILRRLSRSDLAQFQAYRHDPELGRYQGWRPMPDAEADAFLSQMSTTPLFQPGCWAQIGIAEFQGNQLIGDLGLYLDDDGQGAEIGITLSRPFQGKGIATEVLRKAIKLVFQCTGVGLVRGVTDVRNLP